MDRLALAGLLSELLAQATRHVTISGCSTWGTLPHRCFHVLLPVGSKQATLNNLLIYYNKTDRGSEPDIDADNIPCILFFFIYSDFVEE